MRLLKGEEKEHERIPKINRLFRADRLRCCLGRAGSPNATTTVDGTYLPNPPPAFGGLINMRAQDSKPFWPPKIAPPKGAPNVMGKAKMPDVLNGYKWELYNIAEDYSEYNDLASQMPDKLHEMQELFLVEAEGNNVLPLDNSVLERLRAPRPSLATGRNVFTYSGETPGIALSAAPDILGRSFTIIADVDVPGGGAEGMLVTEGGRFGGYGLYLLKGKPVFTYNLLDLARFRWGGPSSLPPGKHTVEFEFKYDGPGIAKGGTGVLKVDGSAVSTRTIPHTAPFIKTTDETFDVGVDTRTPVDDKDYQVPFRFTGKVSKLTVTLEPRSEEMEKRVQEGRGEANRGIQ